jgi:hypothetical protein
MKKRGFDNLFLHGRLTVTKILLFKLEEKMGERLKNKVAIVTGTGSIGPGWGDGIGSCWMTGPLKKKDLEIKAFLGIPEDKEIVGIIPIGIPAHTPKSPPKGDAKTKTKWFGL